MRFLGHRAEMAMLSTALPETRVTLHSGHIGNTSGLWGDQSAVAGVLQNGRKASICSAFARWRENGCAVSRVRCLAQDRLQDLSAIQELRASRIDRSQSTTLPASESAAVPDRETDRAAQARTT